MSRKSLTIRLIDIFNITIENIEHIYFAISTGYANFVAGKNKKLFHKTQ
jgi:hypothetical protein